MERAETKNTEFYVVPLETLMEMPADYIREMIQTTKGMLKISIGQRLFVVSDYNIEMIRFNNPTGLYGAAGNGKINARRANMEVTLYEETNRRDFRQPHKITIELL